MVTGVDQERIDAVLAMRYYSIQQNNAGIPDAQVRQSSILVQGDSGSLALTLLL